MPGAIAVWSCGAKRAAVYQRRRPERTAAYQVVRQNLETWLAQRRVGVVQALAGCGEGCGLPRLFNGYSMEIVQFLLVWPPNPVKN